MKKNKGFTLIELLAVIVILAVIALIATPIIMNVINDSKKGAVKDAMFGYVKAVELATTKNVTATTGAPSGEYQVKDGNIYQGSTKILDITFKGTHPSNDYGKVILESGNVTYAKLKFDGIEVEYDGSKVRTDNFLKTYTVGEVVYLDPTGSISDCKTGKEWTPSNTSTTCYKWNVVKDNGSSIEILLDHNIGNKVSWTSKEDYIAAGGTEAEYGSGGNNQYGPITAMKLLKADTNGWSKVETLTSGDNVTRANAHSGTYTIDYNRMKARIISGEEVADIVGDKAWAPDSPAILIRTAPWLYQNLSYGNTATQPYAYWINTASQGDYRLAVRMRWDGTLDSSYVYNDSNHGVRPVVRVLKSNI